MTRARANELIKVELVGKAGFIARPMLDASRHELALLTACDVHHLTGGFEFAREALLENRMEVQRPDGGRASGAWARLRVIGEGGDSMDSEKAWFLEVDDEGEVVSAWAG